MINKKANCIVSLFLALIVMVVSICSCGSEDAADTQSSSLTSSENVVNLPQNSEDNTSESKPNESSKNVVNLPQNFEDNDSDSKSNESSGNVVNLPQNDESSTADSAPAESSKPESGSSESSKPAAHTHTYDKSVTAPTCTNKGFTTYSCSCGDSYNSDYTEKTAHTWCDWYTYLEPSYTYEGIERRECIICGEIEERTLDKIEATAYYLTDADKAEIISSLIAMGEGYGLTYYPEATGPDGATWDTPAPIYDDELYAGRDYIISAILERANGRFYMVSIAGCSGFGLDIIEYPNTRTGAYYEVYVYWV